MLYRNSESWLHASINDWKYPVSWEYLAIANLYDAFVKVNSDPKKKKPQPHPRPFDITKSAKNLSNNLNDDDANVGNNKLTRAQAIALLNKMNPKETTDGS